jgi:hypothetical protein
MQIRGFEVGTHEKDVVSSIISRYFSDYLQNRLGSR